MCVADRFQYNLIYQITQRASHGPLAVLYCLLNQTGDSSSTGNTLLGPLQCIKVSVPIRMCTKDCFLNGNNSHMSVLLFSQCVSMLLWLTHLKIVLFLSSSMAAWRLAGIMNDTELPRQEVHDQKTTPAEINSHWCPSPWQGNST